MAPIVVIGILAAAAIKGGGFIWGASVFTSPLSEERRQHLLAHAETVLKKLEDSGRSPGPRKIASVRRDLALLSANVASGWTKPHEFRAAGRVANFMGWQHTRGAFAGVGELLRNSSGAFHTIYSDFLGKREHPALEAKVTIDLSGGSSWSSALRTAPAGRQCRAAADGARRSPRSVPCAGPSWRA